MEIETPNSVRRGFDSVLISKKCQVLVPQQTSRQVVILTGPKIVKILVLTIFSCLVSLVELLLFVSAID